uniref:C-type lectin domain-containing protein n=1 Tax=Ditylenchus dipsaci TaxID=166011 RepID=A0A915E5Y6_9BILA
MRYFSTKVDLGQQCYFVAFYKSSSYIQAEEYCIQYNAHLASFHTEQEFEFIADITKRFYGWAYNDFWLGLFHRGELLPEVPNHRLYFLDGSAYNITKFSATEERHSQFWIRHLDKWNSYRFEPDHYSTGSLGQSGSEYCVALSHVDYKLFDQNCSVPSSFVCRYDGPTVKGVDISEKTNSQPFLPPKTAALTVEITAESESTVKSSVGSVRNQPDPTRNNPLDCLQLKRSQMQSSSHLLC